MKASELDIMTKEELIKIATFDCSKITCSKCDYEDKLTDGCISNSAFIKLRLKYGIDADEYMEEN